MWSEAGELIIDLAIWPHAANTRCNGDMLLAGSFTMLLLKRPTMRPTFRPTWSGARLASHLISLQISWGATPSERATDPLRARQPEEVGLAGGRCGRSLSFLAAVLPPLMRMRT
jgi:hypothetical protein